MQENEFEKKMRLKMDELALIPGEEVWKKVALRIRKEKRRKRFLIFLVVFTMLAGTGALYFYTRSTSTSTPGGDGALTSKAGQPLKQMSTPVTKQTVPASAQSTVPGKRQTATTIAQTSSAIPAITPIDDRRQAAISPGERPPMKEDLSKAAGKRIKGQEPDKLPVASRPTQKRVVLSVTATAEANTNANAGGKKAGSHAIPLAREGDESLEGNTNRQADITSPHATKDSSKPGFNSKEKVNRNAQEKQAETNVGNNKQGQTATSTSASDTSGPVPGAKKGVQKPSVLLKQGWKLGATVFAGISNNVSGIHLSSSPADNYQYNTPATGIGSSGNQPISKLQYKRGFTYGLGFYLRKGLGKRTAFSAGVNYHYASAVSFAGDPINATRTFFDAGLQNSATVPGYYVAGHSALYVNRYHLVELPLQLLWRVNKRQDKSLLVIAGLMPSYLVGSQALYANLNQNVYYTDNAQFRKWQAAALAAVEFPLVLQRHFLIAGGPQIQYGLSNMAKTASGTNQHLFCAALRFSVTLR